MDWQQIWKCEPFEIAYISGHYWLYQPETTDGWFKNHGYFKTLEAAQFEAQSIRSNCEDYDDE